MTPTPPSRPEAPFELMRVVNHENWGRLVKTWSTGKSYFPDGKVYPVPRDLATLVGQCDEAGVGLMLPAHVKSLVVYTYERGTMVLRLPPGDLVEAAERAFAGGQPYDLPPFYARCFGLPDGTPPILGAQDAIDAFHACRIGDYTISYCA
jgi:hypothetical protein